MKMPIKRENDEFLIISLRHVRVLTRHANSPGTQKLWARTHENDHKTQKRRIFGDISHTSKSPWNPKIVGNSSWKWPKWRVLGHSHKNVLGFTFVVNHPGTPKLWEITHENGHKTQKDEFLVITLKHVNRSGTPKLWAIAHENVHKTQKWRLFGQTSQTCKSPRNTKTVGNN